jgi:hypothetical protein
MAEPRTMVKNAAPQSRKSLASTLLVTTGQPLEPTLHNDLKQETTTSIEDSVNEVFGNEVENDLQAKLGKSMEMLSLVNQRCQEVESQLKTAVAEAKIFREANISEAEKSAMMATKLDQEVHDRKAVEAWRANVRKMLDIVEDLHWERALGPIRSDAEDIQGWLLKYEGAIEPLIRLTRI